MPFSTGDWILLVGIMFLCVSAGGLISSIGNRILIRRQMKEIAHNTKNVKLMKEAVERFMVKLGGKTDDK